MAFFFFGFYKTLKNIIKTTLNLMHIVSLELLRTFSVATTMDESGTKHSLEAFEEPMEYIVTFGVGADALAGSRKQNRVTGGVHNLGWAQLPDRVFRILSD